MGCGKFTIPRTGRQAVTPDSWHVLGAGAIGCLFASALQQAGCPTTLLLRQGRDATPVTVTVEREGSASCAELPVSIASEPRPHQPPAGDHQGPGRVRGRPVRRPPPGRDQPGAAAGQRLGFAEQLRAGLPRRYISYGTTTEGAYRIETGISAMPAAESPASAGRAAHCRRPGSASGHRRCSPATGTPTSSSPCGSSSPSTAPSIRLPPCTAAATANWPGPALAPVAGGTV